jgi:hypothetical protein
MQLLHTYNDGSRLYKTTIQEVLRIPVWKGNRIMDMEHVKKLAAEIHDIKTLDSGFHTILVDEVDAVGNRIQERYLVDGQHRVAVIKRHLEMSAALLSELAGRRGESQLDFPVTLKEKQVESETEAIDYFNNLNNAKPIQVEQDPTLKVNMMIRALEAEYNKDKKNPLIRQGKTTRPYLCVDDLRKALTPHASKVSGAKILAAARAWNAAAAAREYDSTLGQRCKKHNFFLAMDPKMPWILTAL